MAFALSTFKSALASGGARPSLFEMTIEGNPAGTLKDSFKFVCQVSEIPGVTVTPIEKQYFGRTLKIPGDMVFADLTTTIYNDESFEVRNEIEKWMAGINSHEDNKRTFGVAMGTEWSTGKLKHYDKNGELINTITFHGLWPQTLAEIPLSYDTVSDIEQFDCTWTYQYYTFSGAGSVAGSKYTDQD